MNAQDYQAPAGVNRVQSLGLAVGGAAFLLSLVGAFISPDKFYQAYLFSYMLVVGLTLGSLGLLMLQHLTGGRWGVILRRPLEAASRNVPVILVLFAPIVFGMKTLYSAWLHPEEPLSAFQQHYLTQGGFLTRAAIYFVIWLGLMWLFNKWSKQQDEDRDNRELRQRFKKWSGPGVILYILAMTFAATARKRDKLAAQLTWLANRHILNLPEDRRHGRIVPRNPIARLILPNGNNITVRVIDMSLSGAAIAAENRPPLKSLVMLGKVQSRVVRNLEEGFALEFMHQQTADTLEEAVTAR